MCGSRLLLGTEWREEIRWVSRHDAIYTVPAAPNLRESGSSFFLTGCISSSSSFFSSLASMHHWWLYSLILLVFLQSVERQIYESQQIEEMDVITRHATMENCATHTRFIAVENWIVFKNNSWLIGKRLYIKSVDADYTVHSLYWNDVPKRRGSYCELLIQVASSWAF